MMSRPIVILSAATLSLFTGCSSPSDKANKNLECAALISAASQLSARNVIETDAEFDRKSLFSSMTYLNTYAIPNGINEGEAFEQLNARRAEQIDANTPARILSKAKRCVRKTPDV